MSGPGSKGDFDQLVVPSGKDEAMNLLNEVAGRFPNAISFAAGRPADDFSSISGVDGYIDSFIDWWTTNKGGSSESARVMIGQYSNTNGIVQDLIAAYLYNDQNIDVDPVTCMLTNGAQEAIVIALLGVCAGGFVAAADPTYVGLTGAANALSVPFKALSPGADIISTLRSWARSSPPMKAFYCVPDFSNPGASVMSKELREELVNLAREEHFYIIEDAAYRPFCYDDPRPLPTLKSLDCCGRVIYIESFSKTIMPALRLAVMVADIVESDGRILAERLASIKSYISVASSPVCQAIVGGIIASNGFSLREWTDSRRILYMKKRDILLEALERYFGGRDDVNWTHPRGGFFLTIRLPFKFDIDHALACAHHSGVIVIPVSMFATGSDFDYEVRLSFSNVGCGDIERGVAKFAEYVTHISVT
jgi:(S)-3,5-dihydroxyphenylglycine transaminase